MTFDGVKVFSATAPIDRATLGEEVEEWSKVNLNLEVVETRVLQSSDRSHHCLSIAVFYVRKP